MASRAPWSAPARVGVQRLAGAAHVEYVARAARAAGDALGRA